MPKSPVRCAWAEGSGPDYVAYHDAEWGVPVRDDRRHFEFLVLEGAQAGLSWSTILNKREGYRESLRGLRPGKGRPLHPPGIEPLLRNPAIVRNRLEDRIGREQCAGVSCRAGRVRQLRRLHLALRRRSAGTEPPARDGDVPATTPESDALSKDLKKRGFRFVGSTISMRSCRRPAWSTTISSTASATSPAPPSPAGNCWSAACARPVAPMRRSNGRPATPCNPRRCAG